VDVEIALSGCSEFVRSGGVVVASGSLGLDGEEGTDIGVAAEAAAPKIAIHWASVAQRARTRLDEV
jgi:enamine deaminase RidA (YjgF/YER057c/UK114 family)